MANEEGTGKGPNLEGLSKSAAATAEMAEQMGIALERAKELSRLEEQKVTWASRTNKELKEQLSQQDKILVQLQEQTATMAKGLKIDDDAIDKLEKTFNELGNINQVLKDNLQQQIAEAKQKLINAETEEDKLKVLAETKNVWVKVNSEIQKAGAHTQDAENFIVKSNNAASKLASTMKITSNVLDTGVGKGVVFIKDALIGMKEKKFQALADAAYNLANPMNLAENVIDKMVENMFALDQASTAFQRATGFAGNFREEINNVHSSTIRSGVSMAEAGTAMGALASNFHSFDINAKSVNEKLSTNVALLAKLGVQANTTADIMNKFNKAMGMGAEKSADMARELIRSGQAAGISASKMATDINTNFSSIISYGNQTTAVFKELAAQSKATGVAMSGLIAVGNKFDTFKGATEVAGGLNAILGTQLSAMEMINLSHGERINRLRSEMDMVGGWDSLDRYTKMAVAQKAFDGDMEKAASVLQMNTREFGEYQRRMEASAETQKQLAEATEAMVPIQEKLQLAFAQFAANKAVVSMLNGIATIVGGLADGLNALAEATSGWFSALTFGVGLLGIYAGSTALVAMVKAKVAAAVTTSTAAITAETAALTANTAAKAANTSATIAAGTAGASSAPAMGAFATGLATLSAGMPGALVLLVVAAAMALVASSVALVVASMTALLSLLIENITILPSLITGLYSITASIMSIGGAAIAAAFGVGLMIIAMTGLGYLGMGGMLGGGIGEMEKYASAYEKIGKGISSFATGVASIARTTSELGTNVGDGFFAASVEGGKTSVVMSGDAGVLTNLTSERLTVDVDIPEIKMPQPIVNVYIDGDKQKIAKVVQEMVGVA